MGDVKREWECIIYGVIFALLIFAWALIGQSWAADDCVKCQKITFFFNNYEYTIVDYDDLTLVSPEEIYRAITYLGAIKGPAGSKELKLEIFRLIAPNLYRRHILPKECGK